MATATAITGGIQAVGGIASGVSKFFEGRNMQRRAQELIDKFEWKDLKNAYENNQVSKLGAELKIEEANRNTASYVDALQNAGTRGLVGGLGRVQANNNQINREIASDLDQQQKQIDYAVSGDNVRIRDMEESRQSNELQGYGQMLSTGSGMKNQGVGDVINGVGVAGNTLLTSKGILEAGGVNNFVQGKPNMYDPNYRGTTQVNQPQYGTPSQTSTTAPFTQSNPSVGFGQWGQDYATTQGVLNFNNIFNKFKNRGM